MTRPTRRLRLRWLLPLLALAVIAPGTAGADNPSVSTRSKALKNLQSQREKVRAEKARKAASLDALKASDGEISSALGALAAQVDAKTQELENAQRGLQQAKADEAAANQAEIDADQRLTALRKSMREQAIAAFMSDPGDQDWTFLGNGDPGVALSKRTLLEFQNGRNLDAAERFRSLQEDLALARQAKQEARARAEQHQAATKQHLNELAASQARQQQFQDEVESRLDRALSEADALSGLDSNLSSQINTQQSAIAKQLAAQARASKAARTALSSAGRSPRSSGGGGRVVVTGGSGNIVSVGGIRVDQSIAGNLAALLNAAAAAGIHLSGGGYRDPSGQIAVRRSNCGSSDYAIYQMPASSCRPPTARPGSSMHERGLAIDFSAGAGAIGRGSPAFNWLKANAASFGFYNLPSEPWHWSVNGN